MRADDRDKRTSYPKKEGKNKKVKNIFTEKWLPQCLGCNFVIRVVYCFEYRLAQPSDMRMESFGWVGGNRKTEEGERFYLQVCVRRFTLVPSVKFQK